MQLDYSTLESAEKSAAALAARFQLCTSPHHLDNVRQAVRALQVACQALYLVRRNPDCADRESRACDVAIAISDACEQLRETLYESLPIGASYAPAGGASEF